MKQQKMRMLLPLLGERAGVRAELLGPILLVLSSGVLFGQIQEAWVARYNGGFPSSTNQPIAMALDPDGNVIVAGSSSTNSQYDYLTVKYAPDGTLVWAARYASPGSTNDEVRAFVVDKNGNSYLTGTSTTVKYSPDGIPLWTAPYAGRGIAVDTNGNSYVTGFSEVDFVTVKLDANGSNVWVRTYDRSGCADVSEVVTVDHAGNVYVAGPSQWDCFIPQRPYAVFSLVKYNSAGVQLWAKDATRAAINGTTAAGRTPSPLNGVVVDEVSGSIYVMGNYIGIAYNFLTVKFDNSGTLLWGYYLDTSPYSRGMGLCVDGNGNVYLTGAAVLGGIETVFTTLKLTNGILNWKARYGDISAGNHGANAMGLDGFGGVYVTGFSPTQSTHNDFATLKYDTGGNQKWVIRYDGPVHGDDQATAIAVDTNCGAIYVAGFSQNTSGGYDLVVIKYAELQNIQLLPNGHAFLQFFGTPGQSYRFQATTNFPNWQDIGTNTANASGIYFFQDTNAPAYPYRFYQTVSP